MPILILFEISSFLFVGNFFTVLLPNPKQNSGELYHNTLKMEHGSRNLLDPGHRLVVYTAQEIDSPDEIALTEIIALNQENDSAGAYPFQATEASSGQGKTVVPTCSTEYTL